MTELQFAPGYKNRRFQNWFFMGLAYAFLYWGRYNLTVAKTSLGGLMTNADFGFIFGAGTIVYAFSFLINGPLTDKHGGRITMLWALAGIATSAAVLYVLTALLSGDNSTPPKIREVLTMSPLVCFRVTSIAGVVDSNGTCFTS